MNTEMTSAKWLIDDQAFSLTELADLSGLTEPELNELVEYGVVKPIDPDAAARVFSGECLLAVRMAYRLRTHYELEWQGVAIGCRDDRIIAGTHPRTRTGCAQPARATAPPHRLKDRRRTTY